MHLYLNYNHYVIELLNPTLESLRIITDQLECLKSKYRDFSEIQIAYTDLEADDVDYQTLLLDEAISHLQAIAEEKNVEIDTAIEEIEDVLRDTLDLESVLILHGYRSLKVSLKIAGRRNEFTIKPISDGRVLHDLQILEKKAKDLFFSGTVFTSAYDS